MKTFTIAIVEDEEKNSDQIIDYTKRYASNNKISVNIYPFFNGESFLKSNLSFDAVFMDIELPRLDGVTCSKQLRKKDKNVLIVFITNLSALAIRGYEVSAFDFIVKPLLYGDFAFKLQRIFSALLYNSDDILRIEGKNSVEIVKIDEIVYLEIINHDLIYHLVAHSIEAKGKLNEQEKQLSKYNFLKCNRCYLVNPRHIKKIEGYTLTLTCDEITISRPQKKEFMHAFNEYLLKRGL